MSSSSPEKKKIVLRSSDGESFEVEETVAMQSQTIKHMVEDVCVDGVIPLPNVTGAVLAKVIEFCNRHAADSTDSGADAVAAGGETAKDRDADVKAWDAEFVKVDQATLFDLILVRNLSFSLSLSLSLFMYWIVRVLMV